MMNKNSRRWITLMLVVLAILMVFVIRTLVAQTSFPPRLFDIFNLLISLASLGVVFIGWRKLSRMDWLVGIGVGVLVGILLPFTTLYNPYPFLETITDLRAQGVINAVMTAICALCGLIILHWDGPVKLQITSKGWLKAGRSLCLGIALGVPFAILNGFANAWTQNRAITWQSPLAAVVDAIYPGIVEEIIYRFAFLGLVWLVFRRDWPNRQAVALAGLLALLTHTYSHYSDLFLTQPLTALVMGLLLGLIWGIPLTLLATRRDLESAIGFHWIQDAIRFFLGF